MLQWRHGLASVHAEKCLPKCRLVRLLKNDLLEGAGKSVHMRRRFKFHHPIRNQIGKEVGDAYGGSILMLHIIVSGGSEE